MLLILASHQKQIPGEPRRLLDGSVITIWAWPCFANVKGFSGRSLHPLVGLPKVIGETSSCNPKETFLEREDTSVPPALKDTPHAMPGHLCQ